MRKMSLMSMAVMLFMGAFVMSSCQKDLLNQTDQGRSGFVFNTGDCDNEPVYSNDGPGGNTECTEGYDHTSERHDINGSEDYSGSFGPIEYTISADGKYLTWSGDVCGVQVIVKGGNASYVYTYESCTGASGLRAPDNSGGQVPEISNITFCWNECPSQVVCNDETAYAGNTKGGGPAWWYAFDTQGPATQYIYAGGQMTDGTVTWNGTSLSIDLGSMSLQAGNETVKAQGYKTLPNRRPASGLFTLYKGTDLTIQGNGSRYYVIHLDVIVCE
jgi:hypothetical protein